MKVKGTARLRRARKMEKWERKREAMGRREEKLARKADPTPMPRKTRCIEAACGKVWCAWD